jgi:hypothetical protein
MCFFSWKRTFFAYDDVTVLSMNFTRGFCTWILFVDFHLWVFICELFHLWIISSVNYFICELFYLWIILSVNYFIYEFFLRSMRMKYANEAFLWWNNHHMNAFLQCEVSLHHYITSSHVFFKFHVFVIFTSLSSLFIKMRTFSKRTILR